VNTPRPRCLLTDTDVIIVLHECGLWEALCAGYRVAVPASIVRGEAQFYYTADGRRRELHLIDAVAAGTIDEVAADAGDLVRLRDAFAVSVLERLHIGESEALALLLAGAAPGCPFVTGDQAAIEALAMLGLAERGLSLERALAGIGRRLPALPVRHQFGETYWSAHTRRGQERRITGDGLRRTGDGG